MEQGKRTDLKPQDLELEQREAKEDGSALEKEPEEGTEYKTGRQYRT